MIHHPAGGHALKAIVRSALMDDVNGPDRDAATPPRLKAPRVAAIILNWRRPDDTLACVKSAAALDYPDLDIIVCDNDSQDGSFEAIDAGLGAALSEINAARAGAGGLPLDFATVAPDAADAPALPADQRRLWLVQTGRNGGYAAGNNVGIRLALLAPDTAYVWILNNDTVVTPASLGRLVDYAERDAAIGICGATVTYLEQPDRVQALGGGRFLPSRARCEQVGEGLAADAPVDAAAIEASLSYVNGAAALVRRQLIERVGYMDEGYFLYWEEMDWATRAAPAFRLGYCADALVHHRVGAAAGTGDGGQASPGATYWLTRSRLRYLRLHRPLLLAIAYPLQAKAIFTAFAAGQRRRAAAMLRAAIGLGPLR